MRVSNPVRNLKPTCPFARNWPTVAPTPASCRTRPQIGEMNEPARARPDVQRQRMQGPGRMGLLWSNPKLHTSPRRKTWLACTDHREHLENFLGARSFHHETVP